MTGNYILMTTHPYFADFVDNITITGKEPAVITNCTYLKK